MGDEKRGGARGHPPVFFVDPVLRDGVEGGGGLVQKQDRRVPVESAGQKELLRLASRKLDPVGGKRPVQGGFKPLRQGSDLFGKPGAGGRAESLFPVVFLRRGDVRAEGGGQEEIGLGHQRKEGIVFVAIVFEHRVPVQKHFTFVGDQKPRDQLDQGGLSGSVQTHQRHAFPRLDPEGKMREGVLFASGIAVSDVPEFDRGRFLGEREPRSAVELILDRQEFPEIGDLQSARAHVAPVSDDRVQKGGEGDGGGEVEDEIGAVDLAAERGDDQKGEGGAVPDQKKEHVDQRHEKLVPLLLPVKLHPLVREILDQPVDPVGQGIEADILARPEIPRQGKGQIVELFVHHVPGIQGRAGDFLSDGEGEVVADRAEKDQKDQKGVQKRNEGPEEQKAEDRIDDLGEEEKERDAVGTRTLRDVGGAAHEGLILLGQKQETVQIPPFLLALVLQKRTERHQSDVSCVSVKLAACVKQDLGRRERQHHREKAQKRRPGLQFPQKQGGGVDRDGVDAEQDRDSERHEDGGFFIGFPAQLEREPDAGEKAVLRFARLVLFLLLFSHRGFPSFPQ